MTSAHLPKGIKYMRVALLTFTETSAMKMRKQSSSMLSVRPQGGSQAFWRYRTSDVTVSEEGISMNARAKISVMAAIKILRDQENTNVVIKFKWPKK